MTGHTAKQDTFCFMYYTIIKLSVNHAVMERQKRYIHGKPEKLSFDLILQRKFLSHFAEC